MSSNGKLTGIERMMRKATGKSMSRRGMIKTAQGAFDFKIEADVFVRNGKSCGNKTEGGVEGTRDCFFVKRG